MKGKILNKMTIIALLICACCNGQISDFIVTTSQDTIYVDKISVTDFEVKTKTADKKKKYQVDDIISYYVSKKNEYYVRVPVEKKELTAPDKYDYRRNENSYLEKYEKMKQHKFIQRLNQGKIKLFCEVETEGHTFTPGQLSQPSYMNPYENRTYYISIDDSRLEVIKNSPFIKVFDFSKGLELNKEVYEILKIYLYGNNEINIKLDNLFTSKPIAKEKQIIDLINEYNIWAKSNK